MHNLLGSLLQKIESEFLHQAPIALNYKSKNIFKETKNEKTAQITLSDFITAKLFQ